MFKNIADDAAIMLISHNIIAEEKREAYTYGFELFFEKIFFYGIVLTIALLTKTIVFSLLFMISYKMLRQYTGGFHCKTAEMCLAFSVLIYLIILLLYIAKSNKAEFVLAISSFVSVIIIFIFSPIESVNRPLETNEKKMYRRLSILISAIIALIAIVSYRLSIPALFYSTSCSLTADAVLILFALRRCKNERENVEGFGSDG